MISPHAARGRISDAVVKLQPESRRQSLRGSLLGRFARTEARPRPRGVWKHGGEYHFADSFGKPVPLRKIASEFEAAAFWGWKYFSGLPLRCAGEGK